MNFYRAGYHDYNFVVAIGEKSGGNESVGDMWLETKTFHKETPIREIIQWAKDMHISGKLIITIGEPMKEGETLCASEAPHESHA